MAQEVESLLALIFAGRRKSGKLDLEAVEMATRTALHRAGATVLEELLAGLEVTTKAVERQAEALGSEIAAQEQAAIQQGVQLQWPEVGGGRRFRHSMSRWMEPGCRW